MKHRTRWALLVFVLQPMAVAGWLASRDWFVEQTLPDTSSYVNWPKAGGLRGVLSDPRTFGYPVFLKTVRAISTSPGAVPLAQFLLHAVAVGMLTLGLRAWGLSFRASLCAGSTLFYSNLLIVYGNWLVADSVAMSLMFLMLAALLWALAAPSRTTPWVAFGSFLTLTYLARPAYLFLLPLSPILGLGLEFARYSFAVFRQRWWGLLWRLLLAAWLPALLFCSLRWCTVGHFGVVSFGGYNIIGIVGQFLDDGLVRELPPDLRDLGQQLLERARKHPDWTTDRSYESMRKLFYVVTGDVALGVSKDRYPGDQVTANRELSRLSIEIIRRRPQAYLRWEMLALKNGFTDMLKCVVDERPVRVLLIAMLILYAAGFIGAKFKQTRTDAVPRNDLPLALAACLWLALGIALPKLLLVVFVEDPIHRYLAAASALAPMPVAIAALAVWDWSRR